MLDPALEIAQDVGIDLVLESRRSTNGLLALDAECGVAPDVKRRVELRLFGQIADLAPCSATSPSRTSSLSEP
jgi:hypothetical protein